MKTLRLLILFTALSLSSFASAQCGGYSFSSAFNNPTCFGFSDGNLTVNTSGANGAEIFTITNSLGNVINVANSNLVTNLNQGWYYFSITDQTPCTLLDSIYLQAPGEMSIDLTVFDVLCNGDSTAWARIDTVYNYTGNFNQVAYYWNPNPASISGIGADSSYNMWAGNFSITYNDQNGCSNFLDFTVDEPSVLHFTELWVELPYCRLFSHQNGNGVLHSAGNGGSPNYTYYWENLDNGSTSINPIWGGLNPGSYQITLTDANGCVLIQPIFLDSLNPIADFTTVSAQFTQGLNGVIPIVATFNNQSLNFANPNNPQADTNFYWNYGFSGEPWKLEPSLNSMDTIYNLSGTYNVCLVASNKNGCTDTLCQAINAGLASVEELDNTVLIYPNPNQGALSIQLNSSVPATISVYNASGQIIYSRTHSSKLVNLNLGNVEAGIYTVIIDRDDGVNKGVFVVK